MNDRRFFFGVLIGAAVFIYLIGSFLVATFDITMWKDGQRFLAVAIYLFVVWGTIKVIVEPDKPSKEVIKEMPQEQIEL